MSSDDASAIVAMGTTTSSIDTSSASAASEIKIFTYYISKTMNNKLQCVSVSLNHLIGC